MTSDPQQLHETYVALGNVLLPALCVFGLLMIVGAVMGARAWFYGSNEERKGEGI
jgi:hypothetical protein